MVLSIVGICIASFLALSFYICIGKTIADTSWRFWFEADPAKITSAAFFLFPRNFYRAEIGRASSGIEWAGLNRVGRYETAPTDSDTTEGLQLWYFFLNIAFWPLRLLWNTPWILCYGFLFFVRWCGRAFGRRRFGIKGLSPEDELRLVAHFAEQLEPVRQAVERLSADLSRRREDCDARAVQAIVEAVDRGEAVTPQMAARAARRQTQ